MGGVCVVKEDHSGVFGWGWGSPCIVPETPDVLMTASPFKSLSGKKVI